MPQLSFDSTCSYHCCDQHGHSVCQAIGDWATRLEEAVVDALPYCPPDVHNRLVAILHEDPPTSTTE